ncbi:MAG TPA: hypothetical protein VGS41_11545 [Chthonomonadales bacterium]|nr:hypothetical protein [Chthonomonadales bacterium]
MKTEVMDACAPLFQAAPLTQAMALLKGGRPQHTELIERILAHPALQSRPELAAGLWLYGDNLERSHESSQSIDNPTGAFWHGIMHRREGDYSNSHYWMRRAAGHPLLAERPEVDPAALIDAVAAAGSNTDPELVDKQRNEWIMLFEWCAARPAG